MKKLRITVDGKAFEVLVESLDEEPGASPLPAAQRPPVSLGSAAAAPAPAQSATGSAAPGDVSSPLAGRIVSVDCQVGAKVNPGDRLLTVEAMKMNTYVNSQAAGTVAQILVAAGDAVEEGQILVKIQ